MKKDPFMDGAQLTETLMVSISKAHMQIHGYVTINSGLKGHIQGYEHKEMICSRLTACANYYTDFISILK